LKRRATEQRNATKRHVDRFTDDGILTDEQRRAIHERLDTQTNGHEPLLSPDVVSVVTSWEWFGPPCTVFGGLSAAVVDDRSRLFPSRLEALREAGVGSGAREVYLRLWAALDDEHIAIERKRLADAMRD
jgi:hypothetical protein